MFVVAICERANAFMAVHNEAAVGIIMKKSRPFSYKSFGYILEWPAKVF